MSAKALKLIKKNLKTKDTFLDLSYCKLIEIPKELEACTHLEKLHLYHNQIKDITSLSNLTNLQKLHVQGNAIQNIRSLSGLVNLVDLDLGGNQIQDIEPLENLTNLQAWPACATKLARRAAVCRAAPMRVVAPRAPPVPWRT